MIELLGVGVRDGSGGWRLRGVSSRLEPRQLVAVVSGRVEESRALLECVAGCRVPEEGRVWVNGVPVMPGTVRRVRGITATVRWGWPAGDRRPLVRHVLGGLPGVSAWLAWFPASPAAVREAARSALDAVGLRGRDHVRAAGLDAPDLARLALARALVRRPRCLVVPELDQALARVEAETMLGLLRALSRSAGLTVLAGLRRLPLAASWADHLLVITGGRLAFDGSPRTSGLERSFGRLDGLRAGA